MTCDECRQAIAVADLTDWGDMERVATHCHTCDACAVVVTEVRDSARREASLLDAIPPGDSAALISRRAEAEAALVRQRRRGRRMAFRFGSAATLLAAGIALAVSRTRPAVETMSIPLRCLSSEQAAGLLMPQMGREGSVQMRPPMGGLQIIAVSGPAHVLAQAERTLAQFDDPGALGPGASCSTGVPPTATGGDVGDAAAAYRAEAQRAYDDARRAYEDSRRAANAAQRAAEDRARATSQPR